MRLATKIVSVSLALIVGLTLVAGYFSLRNVHAEFEFEQERQAIVRAAELERELSQAWQEEGEVGIARRLAERARDDSQLQIRWITVEAGLPPRLSDLALGSWSRDAIGTPFSVIDYDEAGERRLYTYLPVELTFRRGFLEFSGSLAPLEQLTRRRIAAMLGLVGAVSLVAILATAFAGWHWVGRPLERLIEKTRRIGDGDFAAPLRLATRDELGQLAEALNEMAQRLDEQQRTIAAETARRLTALEQLRHVDRLQTVGQLAAGVGHELGTPLNVIAGRAALIDSGKLSPEEVAASARTIRAEADRITGIVRHLLDFARRRPPQRAATDLAELLPRVAELLRPLALKDHIELRTQVEQSPAIAAVDGGQLQQVLMNLTLNAIQAMPEGGEVSLELASVSARPPNDTGEARPCWRLRVVDQGPGIPAEALPHIFEPFFTTKDVGQGTGLGLSIAYGIVSEHGGWIDVGPADVAGDTGRTGARFDVLLPRTSATATNGEATP